MPLNPMHVDTTELRGIARKLRDQAWSSYGNAPSAADGLPLAGDAASNLKQNAQTLERFQDVAEAQCNYLADTFDNVAGAYEKVDESEAGRIAGSAERAAAVEAIPVPAASAQLPAIPDGPSLTALDSGGYSGVEETQAALTSGDGGASLRAAASDYRMRGQLVGAHAEETYKTSWEGDAAVAAYTRLNEYSSWLRDLQGAWGRLEQAATKLAEAHSTAASQHGIVALEYAVAKKAAQQLMAEGDPANNAAIQRIYEAMADLQKQSDQIREEYGSAATFDGVKPSDPPFGSRSGSPSAGHTGGPSAPGGGGSGAGGGTGGSMGSPEPAGRQNGAPLSSAPDSAGSGSGGGSSGSGSGGGSPSGGGAPAGGGSGGSPAELPGGLTGGPEMPALPDDASLQPAASEGGGGSGGGGGGGGMPPTPLQPNVGGVSVGPGPAGTAAGGSGAPVAAGAGGGGMGGMGGGMPMGGHGQGVGGKEKKRNPALTPDEDIYSEERPWTEPVIGNRRRREVADTPKDSK